MIQLPSRSATAFLRNLILDTARKFPELEPSVTPFQNENIGGRKLSQAIIDFEAARAAFPHRVDIAESIIDSTQSQMVYEKEGQSPQPLAAYMKEEVAPLPLRTQVLGKSGNFVPEVVYEGERRRAAGLLDLIASFQERHTLTNAAVDAFQWIVERGAIDLTGQKFVILGANAELAPTEILLRAGATVLWIDLVSPEKFLTGRSIQSGQLVYPTSPVNLLEHPREVVSTIQSFSAGDPVHIGAFAYKGGQALETRLAAAMNAIIRRLHQDQIASISFFVSPTSPAPVQEEDEIASFEKYEQLSALPRTLNRFHYFKPNHRISEAGTYWADAIVSRQGTSYLISQYVEKILAAEVWATRGTRPQEKQRPMLVSSNTAGITQTRNMQILAFQLGFAGAATLGLETYSPETTRNLNGLLMLHDLLNPASPGNPENGIKEEGKRADGLRKEQIHGGIYSFPFALEETIVLAGLVGAVKNPRLIWNAVAKKKS